MMTLEQALTRPYPFVATVEPEGGWAIRFPDLPGCTAYAESFEEIGPMARASFEIWLRSEAERGHPLPDPTVGSAPGWSAGAFDVPADDIGDNRPIGVGAGRQAARSA